MKLKLPLLEIPESPTETALHRRVARRTVLAGVQDRPLLLDPVEALDHNQVSSPEPVNICGQVITDQHGERRRRERPVRRNVPRTVRVRGQPALTAGNQLAGRVKSGDHVASNSTTRAPGPTERRGQPRVAHQGDARARELHHLQREPSEPSGMTEVEITSLGAEHVHGIGANGASAVDGDGTHKQPP